MHQKILHYWTKYAFYVSINQSIDQSINNFYSGLSSNATTRTTMGVTVKKYDIYSLSVFSLSSIRTPWGDAPKLGYVF